MKYSTPVFLRHYLNVRLLSPLAILLVIIAGTLSAGSRSVAGTLATMYDFNGNVEPFNPTGGLVRGPDGTLYGVTSSPSGSVYSIADDGTNKFTTLHTFGFFNEGLTPQAGLIYYKGSLYGTCLSGGGSDISQTDGTVFRIGPDSNGKLSVNSTFEVIHTFAGGNLDGAEPLAPVMVASDGNMYGTTGIGGPTGAGTIFQIKPDANGNFTAASAYLGLHDFNAGATDGDNPRGGLVEGTDGALYGTTASGGSHSDGVVYQFVPSTGALTVLHSFTGGNKFDGTPFGDGATPYGEVLQATDGRIYGTTFAGGQLNSGVVYQISPNANGQFTSTSVYLIIKTFSLTDDGGRAMAGPIQVSDGTLCGSTGNSDSGSGLIYQITPDAQGKFSFDSGFNILYDFLPSGLSGQNPNSRLLQDPDGTLIGDCFDGGKFASGNVFRISAGLPPATPPVITGATYAETGSGTATVATVTVTGSNFVAFSNTTLFPGGGDVRIDGVKPKSAVVQSATKIVVTLAATLTNTTHTVVVTDPNNLSASFSFKAVTGPKITKVVYSQFAEGSTSPAATLDVTATNLDPKAAFNITQIYTNTTFTGSINAQGVLTINMSQPLPPGPHVLTLTNPGNVAGTFAFTTQNLGDVTPFIFGAVPQFNSTGAVVSVNGKNLFKTENADGTINASKSCTVILNGHNQVIQTLSDNQTALTFQTANLIVSATTTSANTLKIFNPNGKFATFQFSVAPPPAIKSVVYGVPTASQKSLLVVSGTSFDPKATLTVDGTVLKGTVTAALNSSTIFTATNFAALTSGPHTATVTNPNGQSASFTFNTADNLTPVITSVSVTRGTRTAIAITGMNFLLTKTAGGSIDTAHSATVKLDGVAVTVTFISNDQTAMIVTTNQVILAGQHTLVVQNPSHMFGTFMFAGAPAPTITSLKYSVTPTGSAQLLINGKNFTATSSALIQGFFSYATAFVNAQQIKATLTTVLPATTPFTAYTVTVTNVDGQTTSAKVDVYPPPAITTDGLVAVRGNSGAIDLVVTGGHFVLTDIYGTGFKPGVFVDGKFIAANVAASGPDQLIMTLPSTFATGSHTVVVQNPDLQTSNNAFSTALSGLVPRAATTNTVRVYSKAQSQYQIGFFDFLVDLFTLHWDFKPSAGAGAMQVTIGNSTTLSQSKRADLDALGAAKFTPIISQDGNGIISQDGNGIISQDGNGLIGNAGGTLISQDGNGVISTDGSGVISNDGGSVIATDSAGVVSNDGGSLFGGIASLANSLASNSLTAVAHSTANPSLRSLIEPRATTPPTGTFILTKDEDPDGNTGSSDMVVSATNANGQLSTILDIRYTPGAPDQVVFAAPGVTVTPMNGTPPPTTKPVLHHFSAGLQMIALPASGAPLNQLFSTGAPLLASWLPGADRYALTPQAPANAASDGVGYWVRFAASTDLFDTGSAPLAQPITIPLKTGWNMIGSPYRTAIPVSSIKVSADSETLSLQLADYIGEVSSVFYTYSAGAATYSTAGLSDSLMPFTGYWVYAFKPASITLTPPIAN